MDLNYIILFFIAVALMSYLEYKWYGKKYRSTSKFNKEREDPNNQLSTSIQSKKESKTDN